jgi:regulation of enolase protein 1 (concanavalin A-like superfamily)
VSLSVSNLPLLSVWGQQDIGQVGVPGCGSYASDTFTVQGSGTDIGGTADGFHFVYQPLSGDGTITARVTSLQGAGWSFAKAGVMIRETMSADAADAYMAYQQGVSNGYWWDGVIFIARPSDGGSNDQVASTATGLPYWVRVVRSGNTFSAYGSQDGVNWVGLGSQTVTMAQNVYVGLGVTSANNSALATATFDNVSVNGVMASLEGPPLFAYVDVGGIAWSGEPTGLANVMDFALGSTTGVLAPITWLFFAEGFSPESGTTNPLGWFLYALPGDSIFESRRGASRDR